MPIKKHRNTVHILDNSDSAVLSYFTSNKKAHFCSESKLYESVRLAVSGVSPHPTTYLTTYPNIAVHIRHGDDVLLKDNEVEFMKAVQGALESCLVN